MVQAEEQVLIVYSVAGTTDAMLKLASDAVRTYRNPSAVLCPLAVRPVVFGIPPSAAPGVTLGTALATEMSRSIGAIVFVDDLRPNLAYELGFFHGRGCPVLLITQLPVETVWKGISDLAGCALLFVTKDADLGRGVAAYLDDTYRDMATRPRWLAPELPSASENGNDRLIADAQIQVQSYPGDFGTVIRVDTWGGIVFDTCYPLLPGAKFKIVVRAVDRRATYSIYFFVRYLDTSGVRRTIHLGLTSNRVTMGVEGNERNLPSEPLSSRWRMLTGSFSELFRAAGVLNVERIEAVDRVRVRAGDYRPDPFERTTAFEIGFFQVAGVDI